GTARAARLLRVGAARGGATARVGLIALARRRATDRPRVAGRMLAGIRRSVTLVGAARVAVVAAADTARLLGVGRARRAASRARLLHVALAPGGAADGTGVACRVLAEVGAAVALVDGARVALVGAARAARLLHVRRAGG